MSLAQNAQCIQARKSMIRVGSTRGVSGSYLPQKCEAEQHTQYSESRGMCEALQA